jgi:hypothetical protein
VPRPRNTREENEAIQRGATPAEWEQKPAKNRQKDKDARWTKKHGKSFFGYKNDVRALSPWPGTSRECMRSASAERSPALRSNRGGVPKNLPAAATCNRSNVLRRDLRLDPRQN